MKGFKTRTVRPGSARPKTSLVPGITEHPHPDLDLLFHESKQKEIELEKSRSKLLLHFEAKKSLDEKEILAKKYEDTIKTLNESHNIRMKALSSQHQSATDILIDQFTKEINQLKTTQKSHIDRLLQENQGKTEYYETLFEDLKVNHQKKLEKSAAEHSKALKKLQEKLEKTHSQEILALKQNFEIEKQELIQKSSQDRDSQLKMVINKLCEETRKDFKVQENKLNEEIRLLKFQLESQKLKNKFQEEIVRKSKENFFDSFNEMGQVKNQWSVEKGENFSIWTEKEKIGIGVQVGVDLTEIGVGTEVRDELEDRVKEVKGEFIEVFDTVFEKVVKVVNGKNKTISLLEGRVTGLMVKYSELCALLKSLNA